LALQKGGRDVVPVLDASLSDMMQKKYSFRPVGPADGPIKTAIFGGTNAKLYNYDVSKRSDIGPTKDRFARMKDEYERNGPVRSNLRYGYVRRPGRLVGVRLGAPDDRYFISGDFV
jgi:hypothetical protein